jgi:hypothetical protein
MSYYILPTLAEKFKCDLINIRDPWKKYLSDHDLKPAKMLIDGAHLNDFGNFFMAELIKPLFRFRSVYPANELGLERTYYKGKDFRFTGDTLVLPFYGNKAEVIIDKSGSSCTDSLKVLIDGVPPSSFRGCYFITRPYNDAGKRWPWELPAMIRIRHTKPWIDEEWRCKFTEAEPPFSNFSFTITGSVTGEDGKGSGGSDFISTSGRVIIKGGDAENGGDWHLNRSLKVVKSVVKPGDEVKWKTYSIYTDYIRRSKKEISADNDPLILFQGIPNGSHKLMLIKKGRCAIDISEIRIFKPFYHD